MSKITLVIFVVAFGLGEAVRLLLDNASQLRRDLTDSTNNWYLIDYVGPSTIHYSAKGTGGASEVVSQLQDDQIQYLLYRVKYVENGQTETREVFIVWIGPEVGTFERNKKQSFRSEAENYLQPFHSSITALSKENFNDENISDRSDPLSGSNVID